MKQWVYSSLIACGLLTQLSARAQSLPEKADDLKLSINRDGSQYIKFSLWNQVWIRDIENNPGTAVDGEPAAHTLDAGIRRMRISVQAQLSPRYMMFIQMGVNNQSFITGGGSGTGGNGMGKKPGIFFHDAYNEFAVIPATDPVSGRQRKFNLYTGAGLHSWSGISRLTNASTNKLLTADLPVFNFPTIEYADQFARQFGIFAHGDLSRLAYRFSINKPFATNLTPAIGGGAVDNNKKGRLAYAGYVNWQFMDREQNTTSFMPGSYLGTKKIFNIGAGFYSNADATLTQPVAGEFVRHDMRIYGGDLFVDLPVGPARKGMAASFYTVFYRYDMGPGYLRTNGIMNPGAADTSFTGQRAAEGYGNARYLLGTGSIWYTQAAFIVPRFSSKLRLQPYITYSLKNLDALKQTGHYYDLGTNFLFDGHNAKVSLQYGIRPLYNPATGKIFRRAGETLACIQIFL